MGFLKRFFKSALMTATLMASMTFADAQTGIAPNVRFLETDQVLPAGLWRIRLDGDVFSIQKNVDASNNFATATTAMSIAANGDVTIPNDFFVTGSATVTVNTTVTGDLKLGTDTGFLSWGASDDVKLFRDEFAWELALRDGTNPNYFLIYDTFTDFSNYERARMGFGGGGEEFFIETQTAGTGLDSVDLILDAQGPTAAIRFRLDAAALEFSPGTLSFTGVTSINGPVDIAMTGEIRATGTGPYVFGGSIFGGARVYLTGAYSSTGATNHATLLWVDGTLTAVPGDTDTQTGITLAPTLTTQTAAELIQLVASLHVSEPNITDTSSGIFNAATLSVGGSPTEALCGNTCINAALLIGQEQTGTYDAIVIDQIDRTVGGFDDSGKIIWTGVSFSASATDTDWAAFVDVQLNNGSSAWTLQERHLGAAFVNMLQVGELAPVVTGREPMEVSFLTTGSVEAFDSTSQALESLTDPGNLSTANWAETGDFTRSAGQAIYAHSTGTGTITQLNANLAIVGNASRWYEFTYTVSNITAVGALSASIDIGEIGVAAVPLEILTAGVAKTVRFFAGPSVSAADFEITGTSDTVGDRFDFDDFELHEITGGDINVNNELTWGSDVVLVRDGPWELALRDGNADNFFHVYNQFTNSSNYSRLSMYAGSTSNFFLEAVGVGAEAGSINLDIIAGASIDLIPAAPGSSNFIRFDSTRVRFNPDNTWDIGASITLERPRNAWFTAGVHAGLATASAGFDAFTIDAPNLVAPGQQDSHGILLTGLAHDGSAHDADWRTFVDVTSNAGASSWILQSRIDAAGFVTKLTVDDAGNLVLTATGAPTLLNETSTFVNPTLIPRREAVTTGIGGSTEMGDPGLHLIVNGLNNLQIRQDNMLIAGLTNGVNINTNLIVTGQQDIQQVLIRGFSAQTNDLLRIEQNTGVDLLTFFNVGTMTLGEGLSSPIDALVLDTLDRVGDGITDSHAIVLTGVAFETATPHDADWRTFVDVTANTGASTWTLQERIDAAGFVNVMQANSVGTVAFGDAALNTTTAFHINTTFTGSGASVGSTAVLINPNLTGANGDTTSLHLVSMIGTITTQAAAEVIANVSVLDVLPDFTIGTATIARATGIQIQAAATGGTENSALLIGGGFQVGTYDAIIIDQRDRTTNGFDDSGAITLTGVSYDGTPHDADWLIQTDVVANAGTSRLVFRQRIDGAAFSTKFQIDAASNFFVTSGSFGSDPAQSGPVRIGNDQWITYRDQADGADILALKVDGSDETILNADSGDSIHFAINLVDSATVSSTLFESQIPVVIDLTGTEAFLVRQDADAQDIFTVNSTNNIVTVGNRINVIGLVATNSLEVDVTAANAAVFRKNNGGASVFNIDTLNDLVVAGASGPDGDDETPPELFTAIGGSVEIYDDASVGAETITDGAFPDSTNWAGAVDWSDVIAGTTTYTHSVGNGTLTQTAAQRVTGNEGENARWYRITYTVSAITEVGANVLTITNAFANVAVTLDVATAATRTAIFQTHATTAGSADFVFSATSTTAGDTFTLDNVLLVEIQGGDMIVAGKITGGGTEGMSIDGDGDITFGTDSSRDTIINVKSVQPNVNVVLRNIGLNGAVGTTSVHNFSFIHSNAIKAFLVSGGLMMATANDFLFQSDGSGLIGGSQTSLRPSDIFVANTAVFGADATTTHTEPAYAEVLNVVDGSIEALDKASVGSETITDGAFPDSTNWAGAVDWSDTIAGNTTYTHSVGNGSLTQTAAQRVTGNEGESARWYRITYTVSAVTETGTTVLTITNAFADTAVTLDVSAAATNTHTFQTHATTAGSADFVFSATSTTGGDTFTLDDVILVEIQGGDIIMAGELTGGGTAGLKVFGAGNVAFTDEADISQGTDINTAVTVNGTSGTITTQSATTGIGNSDSFTVTNNRLRGVDDVVNVSIQSYSGTLETNGLPVVLVSGQTATTFTITIMNVDGTNALGGTFLINYAIINTGSN